MKITVISPAGEGDGADEAAHVPENSTVGSVVELVTKQTADSSRWLARVNGSEALLSQAMREGDRLTITPRKVSGAN